MALQRTCSTDTTSSIQRATNDVMPMQQYSPNQINQTQGALQSIPSAEIEVNVLGGVPNNPLVPNKVNESSSKSSAVPTKNKPFCDVCEQSYSNRGTFEKHQKSQKHATNLEKRRSDGAIDL